MSKEKIEAFKKSIKARGLSKGTRIRILLNGELVFEGEA